MEHTHLAHMLRHRATNYGTKEVFRFKKDSSYRSYSWNEFVQQADLISYYLLSKGIAPQDNVGVFSPNMPQWTITDLAIQSIRAVLVPVYATATYPQLKYIVDETEMKVLFVGTNELLQTALPLLKECDRLQCIVCYEAFDQVDNRVELFDELLAMQYEKEVHDLLDVRLKEADPEDLATIIYTSGTTGVPKGAMLTHAGFLASFAIHTERLSLGEDDVSLCFLPLSHIFERAWTYFLLYSGGVNVYNPDPRKVMEVLPVVKPTVMCVVPRFFEKTYEGIMATTKTWSAPQLKVFNWAISVGHQFIEYQKDGRKAPALLRFKRGVANKLVYKKVQKVFGGNIRYMPCSGAAMTPELRRFFHALGLFVNYGYGATETMATVACMRSDVYDFENTGTIMPGVQVKIADDGMILVKGATVFKGYYKKPEETAEVLVDGWYHTGDKGELIGEDTLLMTDRIKDIIKTSTGKFISPQKIELLLLQNEFIDQMCVIGDNRKYLTALIVPAFERLRQLLPCKGETVNSHDELVQHEVIQQQVSLALDQLQSELPPHEKIRKFELLPQPFSIENELMTSSLKVRRKQVNKVYEGLIEGMYE